MDIRVRVGEATFIARAGAVIVRDGATLLAQNDREQCFYTVGGAIELGEVAEASLHRELREELGVEAVSCSLVAVQENFWARRSPSDDPPAERGSLIHELHFFFRVELPENFTIDPDHIDPDAHTKVHESFVWVPLGDLPQLTVFPAFLADLAAADPDAGIRHLVTHEDGPE